MRARALGLGQNGQGLYFKRSDRRNQSKLHLERRHGGEVVDDEVDGMIGRKRACRVDSHGEME
jgi:hypothetical protein